MRRGGQGGELRRDLRAKSVRAGQAAWTSTRTRRRSSSTTISRGIRGIEEFLDRVLAECRENGYVRTILGRRRAISGVRRGAGRQRNLAERTAVNTVIQGSAADLIKLAMIAIHRRLRTRTLSARDAVANPRRVDLRSSLRSTSRTWPSCVTKKWSACCTLNVPLKVDIKAGRQLGRRQEWSSR